MEVGVWWLMSSELLGSVACVCLHVWPLRIGHRHSDKAKNPVVPKEGLPISWLPEPRYQMPETARRGQRYH
ncbi:hypothetical protein DER46DRAFT_140514 [Fusarium sp. MPI-SDFR-AT-0072]|nr:hypothetical protein DER46DRAFT_140514 [Fusarium sp. MPI-SDFR-AT-0072]